MRKTKMDANFIICFLINILLNFEGAIPGIILLILHFVLHISVWWAIGAFLLWIIYLLLWMLVVGFINRSSTPDKPKENKNPYSSKGYIPRNKDKN